ncbi:hypothetical protein G8759_19425 [Spirosoma aureum]|uniref:Uncharacterized protein n=1 Tax=Spirosoma aureum TaxID=2692134 RepID=A0A6G9AQ77_9BACT|nr:hypothetical protein [Spirosoma aureum]QIP14627.1 hypothetical protein G8759_19425 [Spirosoma aureum]
MKKRTLIRLLQQKERLEADLVANCLEARSVEEFLSDVKPETCLLLKAKLRRFHTNENRTGYALAAEYGQVLSQLKQP